MGVELVGSRCRCSVCGRTFRNLAGFDAHRPDRGGCGDPAAAGLVERGGLWATPEGHAQMEVRARQLKTLRTATCGPAQSAEHPPALPGVPHG
jgi:hypothetical protein